MKYIKKFSSIEEANAQGQEGLFSPHVDLIKEVSSINIIKTDTNKFSCSFNETGNAEEITPIMPNNEIWYTSIYDDIVDPSNEEAFGANIISNTYVDGKGIIKFDGNVTSIGSSAFSYCSSLNSITIPNSVTSIGSSAFNYCSSLNSITIPNSVTSIGNYAFYYTSLSTIIIPDSVITLGGAVLEGCSNLTSVTIGNSVASVGGGAFKNTPNLVEFNGTHSGISSDHRTFNVKNGALIGFACGGLTSYTIPNTIWHIDNSVFNLCTNLVSVTIPDSVTVISNYAFTDCYSLAEVICNPILPPTLGTRVFHNNASNRKIKVPSDSVDIYKDATNWSAYDEYIISQ